ncbi:MAG: hypothetical protein V1784_08320, partial [bacterium]
DTETRIEPLIYLGKLFLAVGYPEESRRCLEQALAAAHECGSALGRAHALCELAVYQTLDARWEQAGELLDESERLLRGEEDSSLRWNVLNARLQLLILAQKHEQAASLHESVAALQESDTTFVARARLGLLAMRQGKSDGEETWRTRIADFPEFAWRVSWYQAQKAHALQNPVLTRQEIEKAASRLRMIAEQLADEEQEKYLQTHDVKSFQQWARRVM